MSLRGVPLYTYPGSLHPVGLAARSKLKGGQGGRWGGLVTYVAVSSFMKEQKCTRILFSFFNRDCSMGGGTGNENGTPKTETGNGTSGIETGNETPGIETGNGTAQHPT